MTSHGPFQVEIADPLRQREELTALRAAAGLETTWKEPEETTALHLLGRDDAGQPIAALKLATDDRIDHLAVTPAWQHQGIGTRLLHALFDEARRQDRRQLLIDAPESLYGFFARRGFLPHGDTPPRALRLLPMHARLHGSNNVETLPAAIAASAAIIAQARTEIVIYSRALDPQLLDDPLVAEGLRRFATSRHDKRVRVLLQDTGAPAQAGSALLRLSQRLPSVFQFKAVSDPVDRNYPSAYLINDGSGYYFRTTGNRYDDGETSLSAAARAQQLRQEFAQIWGRSRPCSEFRALGI